MHEWSAVQEKNGGNMKATVNALLALCIAVFSSQLIQAQGSQAAIKFRDDFSTDSLWAPNRYAFFQDDAFRVEAGLLKAELKQRGSAWLFLVNSTGPDSILSFRAQSAGSEESAFTLALTTRHNLIYGPLYLRIDLNKGSVDLWGAQSPTRRLQFDVQRGLWHQFQVERSGDRVRLYLRNKLLGEARISSEQAAPDLEPHYNNLHTWAFYVDSHGNDPNPNKNRSRTGAILANSLYFDDLSLSGASPGTSYDSISKGFDLAGKDHRFTVIYEKGWETWAAQTCDSSIETLRWMRERVFPVDPDVRNLGVVLSRGDYYYKGGGNNNRTGIVFEWDKHDAPGRVSDHELAHDWGALYRDYSAKEGTTNIAQIIRAEVFRGRARRAEDLERRWRFSSWPAEKQKRFAQAILDGSSDFEYEKGGLFWYILYRLIGYEGWLTLHKEIDARGRFLDYPAIRSILEERSGRDFSPVFAGWAEAGQGVFDPLDIFKDQDKDGLSDLDEKLMGSKVNAADSDGDGYADKLEIDYGFHPLDPAQSPRGHIIPGAPQEQWKGLALSHPDPLGDNPIYDISQVSYYLDTELGCLTLRLECAQPIFTKEVLKETQSYTQLYLSTGEKTKTDWRIALWVGADPEDNWTAVFSYDPENTYRGDGSIMLWNDERVIEALIPLSAIEGKLPRALSVDGGTKAGKDRLDVKGSWIVLEDEKDLGLKGRAWQGIKPWTPPAWAKLKAE